MAELPIERLKPAPPFYTTGIDFFGPFTIKGEINKRIHGKCFGVIFNCFVSRAVHVDLSVDYSTDAFLQTMRRFVCLRGYPRKIYSDKGSQLTAASKELKNAVTNLDAKELVEFGISHGTEWEFSTADAPWTNGATEALVKSVKRALTSIIGDQVLSFSELQTVMFEAAQLVNQRPIGRKSNEPDEGSYLCANDLILGRTTPSVPQGPFKERCSHKYHLYFLEKLVEQFWIKWYQDVFPNLVIRQKWHTASEYSSGRYCFST